MLMIWLIYEHIAQQITYNILKIMFTILCIARLLRQFFTLNLFVQIVMPELNYQILPMEFVTETLVTFFLCFILRKCRQNQTTMKSPPPPPRAIFFRGAGGIGGSSVQPPPWFFSTTGGKIWRVFLGGRSKKFVIKKWLNSAPKISHAPPLFYPSRKKK